MSFMLAAILTSGVTAAPVSELAELKRICATLLGTQASSPAWNQLRPYLRDPHAPENTVVICSFTCNGSIKLRHGYQLDFQFPNPGPPRYEGPRRDEGIVWSVTLMRGKQQVFHRELEFKKT